MSGPTARSGRRASTGPAPAPVPAEPSTGTCGWARRRAALRRERLSSLRLARLVGLRHRRARRHGLPHGEHAVHGARPAQPDLRAGARPPATTTTATRSGRSSTSSSRHNEQRPALTMIWYDGGKQPPQDLLRRREAHRQRLADHRRQGQALLARRLRRRAASCIGGVDVGEVTFPQSPGHFEEFVRAIKGGEPAMSNFPDYAGPLTETILLGNLAVWADGKKIEWDARHLKAKNAPEVDMIIQPRLQHGYSLTMGKGGGTPAPNHRF